MFAKQHRSTLTVGVLLLAVTAFIFLPAVRHDFINMDDDFYVWKNPYIRDGLSWHGLQWAFKADLMFNSPNADYWQPMTFISRMMDIQLFGLNPAGHHFMNVLFHLVNVLLLFILLNRFTRALWPSAFTAAVFAIHPMQVETVAWVTARKDLLATFFLWITLWIYGQHTKKPSGLKTFCMAVFYALSVMSKPLFLAFPVLLLFLDFWPLERIQWPIKKNPWRRLFFEKWPLFALSAVSLFLTLFTQSPGFEEDKKDFSLLRIPWNYVKYLSKAFYPEKLAIYYPQETAPLWPGVLCLVGLAALILLALRSARRHPYFLVGIAWFFLALFPAVEILFSIRYIYLALIGIAIVFAWGAGNHRVPAALASLVLCIYAWASSVEISYWKNSASVFERALEVTPSNIRVLNNLASAYSNKGDYAKAVQIYEQALRLSVNYTDGYNNLGVCLTKLKLFDKAITYYEIGIKMNPKNATIRSNLGVALSALGRLDEAIVQYEEAQRLDPQFMDNYVNHAIALQRKGQIDEAKAKYEYVLSVNSYSWESHNNLGVILAAQGNALAAIDHFKKALAIKPDFIEAQNNLSNMLKVHGNTPAVR